MSFKQFLHEEKILNAININITENNPLSECVFRRESEMFNNYFSYIKEHQEMLNIDEVTKDMINSGVGETATYEGQTVPLGLPFVYNLTNSKGFNESEEVELNKPKRGGSKKFYVYVKNDKGNVVKVSFGDPDLSVKYNDEGARKSFVARHKCSEKTDKTKPGYWSCRLPRYAKDLGLASSDAMYW